ncbi:MAG: right-handed parallel beta-helix repeat-containing protein [Planctomycetes bacterium]|nr:right-handed parallel beta-helix repeat-containing protein [Planctomycetota bacterium]
MDARERDRAGLRFALLLLLFALAPACKTGSGGAAPPGGGGSLPVIGSFTALPGSLPAGGGPVTLDWSITGADQISIDHGVGTVTGTTAPASVASTTIFTITASNSSGSATRSVVVSVAPSASAPVILFFTASPVNLPAGGGTVTLAWQVQNASTLSIDHGVGAVAGTSTTLSVAATTIFTLTAANGSGTTTALAAAVVGQYPSSHGGRSVAMIAPSGGELFAAPTTLRLVGSGRDPNVYTNSPSPGLGGNASKVQFFVDDTMVLEVLGSNAEYWIFKGFVSGIAAGRHRVWLRGIYVSPAEVLDSPPMIIDVVDPPPPAQTVTLSADVVLSGSTGYELMGAPGARIRLNGNGHKISGTTSGPLTLKFVDVFDLGDRADTSSPSINVTTTGTVTIEDSVLDTSNPLHFSLGAAAPASVRKNLFRSNMRQPIGQYPGGPTSFPVIQFGGSSTGAKTFAGNNVGAGWVEFDGVTAWLVGGDTDADSNILIGPRVGISVQNSGAVQVRRNYSHHVYTGGWSQGCNFELQGSPTITVEHNIVSGSSWPVRGVGCEFRYNLVLDAGHQWLWADSTNGSIHHNVFAGGDEDVGGIYALYNPQNVRIFNNTFDGQGRSSISAILKMTGGAVSLTSNLFMNDPVSSPVSITGGTLTADYNLFSNTMAPNYSDGRTPAHDLTGNAMLTAPPPVPFDLDEVGLWRRTLTVRDALTLYRARYTPLAGSPAIDAGDPAGGSGNDVGAVGSGQANALDKFGQF